MKKNTAYPKTLILAQNKINEFTGGGIVLSNLFSGASAEDLMFFHRDVDYGSHSVYREYRLEWRWLKLHIHTFTGLFSRWIIEWFFHFRKPSIRDLKSIMIESCYFSFPEKIDQQVKAFKPEILYAWCSDSLWAMTIQRTAERYRIPCVLHFMDNHVDLVPASAFDAAHLPVFKKHLGRLIEKTSRIYTISDSMGKAYEKRWGKPYEVFHGLIDSEKWPLPNNPVSTDEIFRIVFTGSVEQGQLLGLHDLAAVIEKQVQDGVAIKLVLYLTAAYASYVKDKLGDFRCVEILPHPDFSLLRQELSKADLLVLAFGFDEQTINYYRYSFATKIVPYMLSGRAILVYGPDTIEPVRYAIQGDWAYVVSEKDDKLLLDSINTLMDDREMRENLASKAWNAGVSEHDLNKNALRFSRSLAELSRKH